MKISRKTALQTLGLGLAYHCVLAKQNGLSDFKKDFMIAWESSEKYTLELFDQMPEKLMDWKYTPESFTWRMQYVHCIIFNSAQFASRLGVVDPWEEITMKGGFWSKLSKNKLQKEIVKFYDWVRKIAKETSDEKLTEMTSFGSGDIPLWRLFYALENHIIHHRGQAVCYLRLNGITPIGYVGW
jgi:hypothetical protein